MDVMVDLETLGNGSNAAIIAIGAVEFDPTTRALGREFYQVVDAQSSVDSGMAIDASTVMWWMKQNTEAKRAFNTPGTPLFLALGDFANWYPEGANFWGNGATFDNVILSNAYKLTSQKRPWPYQADRCYRTLKALFPNVEQVHAGVAHNALDDAKSQALHAIKLLSAHYAQQSIAI